jgi:hypothetical protein
MRVSSYSLVNFPTGRNQCCGSGFVASVCFWASRIRIRIRWSQVRIRLQIRLRILPSLIKLVRKPLFPLFCDFFMTFYQCSGSASGSVCVWTSRIRYTEVQIRGSGSASRSVTKCHGSTTLVEIKLQLYTLKSYSILSRKGGGGHTELTALKVFKLEQAFLIDIV